MTDPIAAIFEQVGRGELGIEDAVQRLRRSRAEPLGFATVDHDRHRRCGVPEVVLAKGKTSQQVVQIARTILDREGSVLITRAEADHVEAVKSALGPYSVEHGVRSGTLLVGQPPIEILAPIPVVTAGTGDEPVAEEACLTCKALGQQAVSVSDVGVAGLHRLGDRLEELRRAHVIVCIAGMEGALSSVIGGLVAVPVIAVPTSVGYGASFDGISALLGMLTSCASGVVVVNIDNGFGAAYAACLINRVAGRGVEGSTGSSTP